MDVKKFWEVVKVVGDWIIAGGDVDAMSSFLQHGTNGSLRSAGSGHAWEQVFIEQCNQRKLTVQDVSKKQRKYDLIVCQKRVQCKFVGAGRNDIGPGRRNSEGVRKYHIDDFDVLAVAVGSLEKYCIIPANVLANHEGWLTPSFRPHLWEWKHRWDVFQGMDEPTTLF